MPSSSSQNTVDLFSSKEKLEQAASEISSNAAGHLHQATYLYFLARFLVIYYEVNFAELPIQVWNEYRNALDHYFRSITEVNQAEAAKHISKMEGHLQRAVLDICKIICHKTEGRFSEALSSENQEALRLIDNGGFHPRLLSIFKSAKDAFVEAKAWDLHLGDGASKDRDIVGKYLQAFYSYRDAELYLEENRSKIHTAEQTVKSIKYQSSKHHVRDSLIAKVIWGILMFILGWGITLNWTTILEKAKSILNH